MADIIEYPIRKSAVVALRRAKDIRVKKAMASRRPLSGVQSQPLAARGPRAIPGVIMDVPLGLRALGSVTSQPLSRRGGVFSGGLFRGGIGDDAATPPPEPVPAAVDSSVLDAVNARADQIAKMIDDQDKNRKLALMIAGASALFAAVKLGLIAFPHIKARVTGGG